MTGGNQQLQRAMEVARRMHQERRLAEAERVCEQLLKGEGGDNPALAALYGAILLQSGRQQEGRILVNRAADTRPTDTPWTSDLGLGLLLSGHLDASVAMLERASQAEDADGVVFNRLGTAYLALNRMDDAERAYQEAVLRDPDRAAFHNNLGSLMLKRSEPEEALVHYERALAVEPGLSESERGRSAALVAMDRADEAVQELAARLEEEPDSIVLRRRLARLLALVDQFQEAEDYLREALDKSPEDLDLLLDLARLLNTQDRYGQALKLLEQAHDRDPENNRVINLMARTLNEMGRYERALELVEAALEQDPGVPASYVTRASIYNAMARYEEAEADLRHAVEVHPGAAEAWSLLGHNLLCLGRLDEASDAFKRAAAINPSTLAGLVETHSLPDDPRVLEQMKRIAGDRLIPGEARASMHFALVKVYDGQGDYAAAFEHAKAANALQRRKLKYSAAGHTDFTNRIMATFTPELVERCKAMGSDSERPVFVVGMPRSGTTLLEQVLASHPDVFGAGELNTINAITRRMPKVLKTMQPYPECMEDFWARTAEHGATYYLKQIRLLDRGARRVVDKMPHNFQHLGLISLLFPRASIIHIERDPRDVAISNYFTNFKHKRGGMAYAFDLAEIGHMLNDYQRLMAHWHRVLPGRILDVRYEDLVADQEAVTHRLLDHVGLPWDEHVLAFHETERPIRTASVWQVRQPLYQSSRERWRNYAAYLAPLEEVLAETPERRAG